MDSYINLSQKNKTKKYAFVYDIFLTLILAITILWILYVSIDYNSYKLYCK